MGDFIAQIKILGDILALWAIKFVNKNAKKALNLVFWVMFLLACVVKYVFWRYVTSCGGYLGLIDLATLYSFPLSPPQGPFFPGTTVREKGPPGAQLVQLTFVEKPDDGWLWAPGGRNPSRPTETIG